MSLHPPPRGRRWPALALIACVLGASGPAWSADLLVRVSGLAEPLGQVGCSLFSAPAGFPMEAGAARVQWLPAEARGVVCRFADVPEGRHAVSVVHDLNGNRRVDVNLVGLPTEPWGVSNQVRPRLRAPRFDEAAFAVPADARELVIEVQLAR